MGGGGGEAVRLKATQASPVQGPIVLRVAINRVKVVGLCCTNTISFSQPNPTPDVTLLWGSPPRRLLNFLGTEKR